MNSVRVSEFVDIQAPREEVFGVIANLERRMQLSPLWGTAKLEEVTDDYPAEGSYVRMRLATDDQPVHESMVTEMSPLRRLAYRLCNGRDSSVCWAMQDVRAGTRLTYTEDFVLQDGEDEEFTRQVREAVRKWLENIQRYSELRQTAAQRALRLALDRFYLRLRPDQRRLVATILFMQAAGTISFVMAALAYGFAQLFV